MHNHKMHNKMQMDHGKIAMTESVKKDLDRKGMFSKGGKVPKKKSKLDFAKAILSK